MGFEPGFDGFPLTLGSIISLRSFRLTPSGQLTGVVKRRNWHEHENTATCEYRVHRGDKYQESCYTHYATKDSCPDDHFYHADKDSHGDVPEPNCHCGFWSYNGDYPENRFSVPLETVSGVVEAYGRTVVGMKGYRSEKARILALCLDTPLYRPDVVDPVVEMKLDSLTDYSGNNFSALSKWMYQFGLGRVRNLMIAVQVLAGVLMVATVLTGLWPLLFLYIGWLGLTMYTMHSRDRAEQIPLSVAIPKPEIYITHKHISKATAYVSMVEAMREKYPNIPLYDSIEEMLKDFPLSQTPTKD
jgi:hypothetical protein